MSNHPYRQRLDTYNLYSSPNSSQYNTPQSNTPQPSSGQPSFTQPYPVNDPIIVNSDLQQEYENADISQSMQLLKLNQQPLNNRSPYPVPSNLDSQPMNTPPPVFSTDLASPPSNPLSATSSVTNLNIGPNIDQSLMNHSRNNSQSQNALSTPSFNQHNRSVSSTSSFFDRSDNMSLLDFNQNLITQYLGEKSTNLMPRIKTIELYRKNAKKSNDPTVLFQYAQYMLQTALLLEADSRQNSGTPSVENSPMKGAVDSNKHKKSKSVGSFDLSNLDSNPVNDKQLRRSLLKEAMFYLKKLSDKGYVDAQYLLGDAYSSGALGKVDNKEAFSLFQAAAKHGHFESAYRTSYCYEEGLGTGRDARKAVEYLKMAASKNHPAAMYKLGVYMFYGRMGLSQSDVNTKKMGIKWLTRASNVANELIAAAPYELGKIYFNGFKDIVLQDQKYALELYSQAAALGHIQSSAILGHFYEVGEIVPQDSNLSIHYYTQAALGGDPNSMLAMCAWYLVGNDPYLPKDENESFEWAKRAAMCNLAKGQFALANFYDKGIGCTKNNSEAQKWYVKAAENGDEKAIGRLTNKELAAKLQKQVKKKKSSNNMNQNITSQLNFDNKSSAQEKDCVIV